MAISPRLATSTVRNMTHPFLLPTPHTSVSATLLLPSTPDGTLVIQFAPRAWCPGGPNDVPRKSPQAAAEEDHRECPVVRAPPAPAVPPAARQLRRPRARTDHRPRRQPAPVRRRQYGMAGHRIPRGAGGAAGPALQRPAVARRRHGAGH